MVRDALALDKVNIAYGHTQVVHEVSLAVARSENFALVGESGSGKSTVLKVIAALATDWTGSIEVMGEPRTYVHDLKFARQCQRVFQDPYGSLHPRKTIDTILAESRVA